MRTTTSLSLLLAASLLAGCVSASLDVPRADNYPASDQKKARSVHHWDVLAEDVAGRIVEKLQKHHEMQRAIYVAPSTDSAFNQSFRNLLITRLLDKGVQVATRPGTLNVTFETQVIKHNSKVSNGIQMPLTALAAGVAVARDLTFKHTATAYTLSALGVASVLDASQLALHGPAAGGPTQTEVLITTSLSSDARYLARTSDVYYIERSDSGLYSSPESSKTWKVVGQ